MALYDDTTGDGYGVINGVHGGDYLDRAADAATGMLLSTAAYYFMTTGDWEPVPEDISAEFPGRHSDVPFNDSYDELEGLLQDDRIVAIIERYSISPERFGHDFTLTRNREDAGFWDRGYDAHTDADADGTRLTDGDYLTEMAHGCGGISIEFTRDADGSIDSVY